MSLNMFDKILYINLEHRKDRENEILSELKKLKTDKNKVKKIEAFYTPFNGHAGCVLSHIKALDYAIKNSYQNILILEDDCQFIKDIDFIDYSIYFFFKIIKKWDVFLLGGQFENLEKTKYPFVYKVNNSFRSHAYAINSNYFKSLKNHFEKTYDILKVITLESEFCEYALDRRWQELQRKDLWYTLENSIASQREGYSDIHFGYKKRR